ncbi:MAG: GyrI-like domain-containing protein [Candidatus Izemoplasmatales bacterium]
MRLSNFEIKKYYQPKTNPMILEIPTFKYITIDGMGNPNGALFQQATEALYAISYAIKMSYKKETPPEGYYEYKVFPLEGIWDLIDKSKPSTDKDNYRYTLLIQQPDFVTEELFRKYLGEVMIKKSNPKLKDLKYQEMSDGLVCQMLHIGPYDDEPASFSAMKEFMTSNGYIRDDLTHKEIYLSDPRRTDPSKLKTILRFHIRK